MLACALYAGSTQADCVARVIDTQAQVQALYGELDPHDNTRLTALLLDLCEERDPGSSVSRTPERTVITTHGLNEKQIVVQEGDVPVYVEIDGGRRFRKRADEPRRME